MVETSTRLPPTDGRLTGREWLALILGAAALLVFTYMTEPTLFESSDWLRIHAYYKEYLAAAVRHGQLPFWNPHVALGRPFLADVDSVAFYPPNAVFFLFDAATACLLAIGFHLFLGLYGSLKLARGLGINKPASWAVAFVFISSAPIVGSFSAGQVNYGAALCFIPLVFYLCLRLQAGRSVRLVAGLALLLGFQLLSGHPQATWLTDLGAGLFLVGRRMQRPLRPAFGAMALDLVALLAAVALSAAMAAVMLLPLGELAGQSNRQGSSLAFAASYAMNRLGWMTLAIPTEEHFPVQVNSQMYAGSVVFLTAPCALLLWRQRNVRALALLLLLAGLLAAGEATPVFRVLYCLLPGLGHFRIPSRASVLVTLSLVLLAGLHFSTEQPRRGAVLLAGTTLAGLLAGAQAARLIAIFWGPKHFACAWARLGWHTVLVLAAAGLVVAWWRRDRLRIPCASAVVLSLLALLSAADLAVAAANLKPQNRETLERSHAPAIERALRQQGLLVPQGPPPRIFAPLLVFENAGMRHGWSSFTGYTSMTLGRVWEYIYAVRGLAVPAEQVTFPEGRILEQEPFSYDSMALQLGARPHTTDLLLRASPDPRAYLAPAALSVRDVHEAIRRMRDQHPFHRVALIERPAPASIPAQVPDGGFDGRVEIARFEPERIALDVQSPKPAMLVVAEAWFPGWSASINGQPAPCFPANAWMRAVPVPAGRSQVVLSYRSTYFATGAAISLVIFALLLALVGPRRKPGLLAGWKRGKSS